MLEASEMSPKCLVSMSIPALISNTAKYCLASFLFSNFSELRACDTPGLELLGVKVDVSKMQVTLQTSRYNLRRQRPAIMQFALEKPQLESEATQTLQYPTAIGRQEAGRNRKGD